MPSSPVIEASTSAFLCGCEEWARPACLGLPFFKKKEGKPYCVLHYPGKEKGVAFKEVLKRKLDAQDFKFHDVWFPDSTSFREFNFTTDAYFFGATFNEDVAFDQATFSARAHFSHATFNSKASFFATTFGSEAHFGQATFIAKADFTHATFSALAGFYYTMFSAEAHFELATFKDYVRFTGNDERRVFSDTSSLNLQFARIEKPERVSFHTVKLRPHWFVNVDARKFEFTSVDWHWYGRKIRRKLKHQLSEKAIPSYRLLAIACRQLAVNAEENNIYWRASTFRYLAMNVERLDTGRGFAFWTVSWWYWLASGFGERTPRALAVFLIIWLSFALLFSLPSPVRCPENNPGTYCLRWEENDKTRGYFDRFSNSAVYAVEAMTLQKPEPHPASPAAHLAVLLCTLLGPVQAALLALALRRKVMR